ncbi:SMP-30/gluconolactonase/LRE family protein [Nonomuraea turkmeniaca]|uniref:SMP-30/gluconolactonase/LRE family protein n=1 Tax=Nonomuraea turkmeniaca TaxID=103838 RepID=A0A5S4FHU0_9ACTN|nr:SMP-30/gluconolactonase/LRE family protein [Nonomuraea turkmeniaca]TMR18614.1 SMP-30/gluconolactonase/LRE family protein [Nonomuraea turkmeniaca]
MTKTIPTQFEVLDERFAAVGGDDVIEVLYTGTRWAEGPVYFPAGRFLVWSDIPNERMLRWDEMTGAVGPFRRSSGYVNGNTLDREGRLISCEHGNRRVTRTEHDGSITVIADRWEGKRLNSPNDVVVRSDGSIWFTDPPYGILSNYEGHAAEQEIDGCHVYRADPVTGEVRIVADDFNRPNGLAFSLDESLLYVADTRERHLRVFDVREDGTLAGGKVFAAGGGDDIFDGMRLDDTGRIWAAAGKALLCYDPDGTLIGRLKLPEATANLVFGGLKRNRLFIAASTSLYSLMTNVTGARPVWARR